MKGKTFSKGDFTKSLLPLTRREQFLDWLKMDYGIFFKIGFVLLLCALPMIATLLMRSIFLGSLDKTSDIDTLFSYIVYEAIFDAITLLASLVLSIGIGGVSRVYRLMSWNEPSMFKSDFFQGVKSNYKNIFIVPVIVIGSYMIINFSTSYLALILNEPLISDILGTGLIAVLIFSLIPPLMMSISMNSYYSNTFTRNFSNSFRICAHHYFPIIMAPLFVILVVCLFFIPNPIILFISFVALIVFVLPIVLFAWRLLCLSYFDKYINKDYKEYLNKGLRTEGDAL